jgi:hypothetical protein
MITPEEIDADYIRLRRDYGEAVREIRRLVQVKADLQAELGRQKDGYDALEADMRNDVRIQDIVEKRDALRGALGLIASGGGSGDDCAIIARQALEEVEK